MNDFISNNPSAVIALGFALVGVGIWLGSMQTNISALKEAVKEIKDDIKKIFDRLPSKVADDQSPLQLNDLGKRISIELEASEWARTTALSLYEDQKGKQPYEIQEFCQDFVRKIALTEQLQNKVYNSAYQHGISKGDVLEVMAIELRDELLRQLGVTLED